MLRRTRSGRTAGALVVGLILAVSVGTGAVAARPESGGRDIQDFAQAGFQTRLNECLFVDVTVRYFAGDNLQAPIGSGKPGSWSDAPVNVGVFDSCDNDNRVLQLDGLGFPVPGPDFDRLDRAVLDVPSMLVCENWTDASPCDGSTPFVAAEVHLVWSGNDDASVSINHQLDSGTFRQERVESASVTGSVEFGPSEFWAALVLTGDDAHDAAIGTANEISLP